MLVNTDDEIVGRLECLERTLQQGFVAAVSAGEKSGHNQFGAARL